MDEFNEDPNQPKKDEAENGDPPTPAMRRRIAKHSLSQLRHLADTPR
jgi:hypothetical protein